MTKEQKEYKQLAENWLKENDLVNKTNLLELSFLKEQIKINTKRIQLLKTQIIFNKRVATAFRNKLNDYLKVQVSDTTKAQ